MELEKTTFGAGCFWCVEAIFSSLNGVEQVVPGYCGGITENPSYEEVCSGTTEHAEVCQITFNPELISFSQLLEVYWKTHNPTTLNRQGPDIGTQYRSVIYYHSEEQRKMAEDIKVSLGEAKIWEDPILTQIEPLTTFYIAEDYHKDYVRNNPSNEYCSIIVIPKIEKFKKVFKSMLK